MMTDDTIFSMISKQFSSFLTKNNISLVEKLNLLADKLEAGHYEFAENYYMYRGKLGFSMCQVYKRNENGYCACILGHLIKEINYLHKGTIFSEKFNNFYFLIYPGKNQTSYIYTKPNQAAKAIRNFLEKGDSDWGSIIDGFIPYILNKNGKLIF